MKDIWLFLFFFGMLLFGWPMISMFGPHIALYFFSAWIIYIMIIFILSRSSREKEDGG